MINQEIISKPATLYRTTNPPEKPKDQNVNPQPYVPSPSKIPHINKDDTKKSLPPELASLFGEEREESKDESPREPID